MLPLLLDRFPQLGEFGLFGFLDVLVLLGLLRNQTRKVSYGSGEQRGVWMGTYLFALRPALAGSGSTSFFGRAVGVTTGSHGGGGRPDAAGEGAG